MAIARRRSRSHRTANCGAWSESGERPGGTLPASLAKSAIALRPATPADAEFCYRLHKAAMGEYITATWGWDEQVQRAFHDRAFNPHRWQIITAGQVSIGMLDVEYRPGEIYLSRIEIDPGYQRHGIGSRIISALLEEAERTGPGPGSRRADGQPPRTSALPAAWPDRSRQPRRTGYQGHHAVRPASEVAAGEIAAKVRDLPRSVGLGQNRPGARVESAGSKVGPVDVPTLMPGLPHSAEPQWHIRHGVFRGSSLSTARRPATGSGVIAAARTTAARWPRSGSWRRSGRRPG